MSDERFWATVSPEPNTGCFLWTGTMSPKGYGRVWFGGRMGAAHRVAYELVIGAIPSGLQLDHLCRVRCCVNPAHLEPVTNQENIRRGMSGCHQRNRTHCPAGHEYAGANLHVRRRGRWVIRICRACRREENRVQKAKRRGEKRAEAERLATAPLGETKEQP